jgi:Uma2 family endonuclease
MASEGGTMYDAGVEGRDPMHSTPEDTRLTYDDLLLFPDDGKRHEIIDGEHFVTASPNTRHQVLVGRLYFAIELFLREHPGTGRVFMAPFDIVFTRWDVVEPDLLFIGADQMNILTDKNVQGAPALVIEILSPATRKTDEQIKRRLFERGGVREYWLVDPELDVVKVFRRSADGGFPRDAELSREAHDVLTTPVLPGLAIPLHELLAAY